MTTAEDWGRARPLIEAALATSPGLQTIQDVERAIESGAVQFWAGKNCAAITEITTYDRKKAITVIHGGGDLAELLDVLEPSVCAFGRSQGCEIIMGTGREGWKRVTKDRGYRFGWLTMVKDL